MSLEQFSLAGKTAVVTGGTGVLGGAIARGLAAAGAKVGILGRREQQAREVAAQIEAAGGIALALPADVLDRTSLQAASATAEQAWGRVDILVNAAGGNVPAATVMGDLSFFDLGEQAIDQVVRLNFHGSLLPTQVFGAAMVRQEAGSVINISSMAAQRALTRVVGYGAAKSAIDSLTRWLAVEMAQKYSPRIRVNAIAPGFFIGDQNRALMLNPDGSLTARGQTIVGHTPMARFGEPDELVGAAVWLASEASSFVTGVVLPIDGGFSAFSGV
ncbi:SDR family oxidoreductase [Chloroflexia bacterium SDU3-3]|nr:SDR family oxidoreductase [Chloroflexia bacterium SDU3-3]